jgi:nitrite reductase (NADH) large subunit
VTLHDREHETYARLVFEVGERRLLGGILVGDTGPWDALHSCLHAGRPVPARAEELLFAPAGEDDEVCQCNHVTRSELRQAIRSQRLVELSELKRVTKAGTGCGSCLSKVAAILAEEAAPQAPRSPARRLVRRTRRSR